ncbi:thiolase C-terminal domain-containing protein [Mycobacterium avium]|uniref:thiolase C-terminal domain-containing protein n=1 Tax=Mycobacterium avium TaxID=1764 RepID=UPI001CDCC03A|nr:OB-fold domain-containing protein [Mycobacterium avium]MCA4728955.1 OB-fold domain-containing protein [Mycobacterium avium subsp. hominissuis]MDO2357436.1 OB-fold domain-containing protein [Mycobacterium avium subsp. hominissuis]UBV06013.1 OB-fold domain-containing protein [Mycobacterium avium subsp. hominissuis]
MSASGRPLPLVTEENEFFWTSGADGKLRLQECRSCASLIHPPAPVCRYCRSRDIGVRAVSGSATLAGFTVNHRFSLPGMPAPYVIAQVAIAEDPRVRLTTNIVECDPDRLELGQAVEVVFEQADDVWFPLFRPSADGKPGPLPADEIAPERFGDHVRPMLTTDKFEDKVALTGIGMSPIGRRLMQLPLALTVQACEAAIADAGLTYADIDGLSTYPGAINVAGMGEGGVTALEAALGIRPTWHNGAMETFGPGGSVIAAMLAVAGGLARHVLCFRTLWEATHAELMKQGKITPSMGRMQGWQMPFGATSAAHTLAMNAQRHFHRYGTTKETLGWIALNQRANAELNPTAIYRSPMTMEDYLGARPITTPFGLYDCDVPCDGAIAVIVSAVDAARDLAKPPVLVEAVGTQIIERTDWDQSTLTHEPQVLGQAAHVWTRTSLRPSDVDVAELYDGFSFNCLSWIEALGFCGIGEAKEFLDGGKNIARDGQLPLNTHGGQLSHGRTHGMGLLHEAITQLRGEAGDRQVADARVGVVSSGGLTPSGVILLRADR